MAKHVGNAGFLKRWYNNPIERGRRPNTLKYYVNEQNVDEDEAQGEKRQLKHK